MNYFFINKFEDNNPANFSKEFNTVGEVGITFNNYFIFASVARKEYIAYIEQTDIPRSGWVIMYGFKGRKTSPFKARMDSSLIESLNTSFSKVSSEVMTLLPNSIEGLMGLWEEQPSSLISFKGPELSDGSSPFKWELFSEPLDCPPNEGFNPEPREPLPFRGGEEVRNE
jgi:hypothetical protein